MINFGLVAMLAVACLPVLPACLTAAGDGETAYITLSQEIIKYARTNAVNKLAVLDFEARGLAGKTEAEYVSEKMGTYLAGRNSPMLIERAMLEKVLKEAKLSSATDDPAGNAQMLQDIFSIDAIVTGTVFAEGGKLKILARLIDIKTGRVLFSDEAETWTEQPEPLASFSDLQEAAGASPLYASPPTAGAHMELPGFADPAEGDTFVDTAPDFRERPAASNDSSCTFRQQQLTKLNSELVDTKARYWADKMKDPGFNARGLRKNPGSEIGDPELKARFYKLLKRYDEDPPAPPEPEQLAKVINLITYETRLDNDCAL